MNQTSEGDHVKEKAPKDLICDEFLSLERHVHTIAVLRDGIREADGYHELYAWRDIIDMTLESEVHIFNSLLKELAKTFQGISFKRVRMSSYSMLRGNLDLAHLEE